MTPEAFARWLAEMQSAGIAPSDRQCAILLGVLPKHIGRYKARGGDARLSLACAALLHRLEPYE
ncbi:MAG: hypothetical protein ACK4NW_02055 [Roseinatronobacter sp.]